MADTVEAMSNLTDKQEKFCRELARLGDGKAAYRITYNALKMNDASVASAVSHLLADPKVAQRVANLRAKAADRFEIKHVDVLRLWWRIATADANALICHRRVACRYCHGVGFQYQWRDETEWANAVALALAEESDELPSLAGGVGFNHTVAPHSDCPQCCGEGIGDVFATDTRKLGDDAKVLYAGVKKTRGGFEIQMRNQDEALANIARHLGMFNDRLPGAANGNPMVFAIAKDAKEAAKQYAALMGAGL